MPKTSETVGAPLWFCSGLVGLWGTCVHHAVNFSSNDLQSVEQRLPLVWVSAPK